MNFTIKNIGDWQKIADRIIPLLDCPILLLKGDLGVGKTTFTQILLKKLGSTDEVSSPTYSIVNEYHTPRGTIFHFDLYRMKKIQEVYDIGIEEYLDSAYLNIIEWPEIYEKELYDLPYHELCITKEGDDRVVTFR